MAVRKGKQVTKQQVHRKKVIYPVESGLASEETEKQYKWHFATFLKWVGLKYSVITPQRLLQLDELELQDLIIKYLDVHMHKEKGLSRSSIRNAMASILHFLEMNDIILNRRKIAKFVPRNEKKVQDRGYTRKEIQTLIDNATDKRFKTVILLLANGLRIGAIPGLEIRDKEEMPLPGQPKIYKINVYARSQKDEYYTFVTPECTKQIDDYLEFRRLQGEDTTIGTSPLIREQFEQGNRTLATKPRKMSLGSIEKTFERTVKRSGINTFGKVMMSHGCRKFAITEMIKEHVDWEVREFLVGHKHTRGVTGESYDRLTPADRLEEWKKCINALTIDKSFQLEKEIEVSKSETALKIAELQARNARLEAEHKEEYKRFGELQKDFNEMKQWLGGLNNDNREELLGQFYKLTADKVQDEYYNSDEYKQGLKQKQKQQRHHKK